MAKRDYYEVLDITRGAKPDQIKRAYRKLAKKYHPDHNPDDKTAEARFKEVQEAYDLLSDPAKRRVYDQFGHAGAGGTGGSGEWRTAPGGQRVYTWSSGRGTDIPIENFEDLFSIFGGPGGDVGDAAGGGIFDQFMGGAGRRRRVSRPSARQKGAAGRDLEHAVSLTFDQAISGTTLETALAGAGPEGGAERIRVKIPAGVADGQRIRVRGKGRPGGRGIPRGDLYIVCRVQPHPYFRRFGNDIYLDLPLSITEAALGTKVEIPTVDGKTVLTVPPGTPSGGKLRLKNKGVKPAGNKPRGHQYAVVRIVPPKSLTPHQRELLEQLRQTGDDAPREHLGW